MLRRNIRSVFVLGILVGFNLLILPAARALSEDPSDFPDWFHAFESPVFGPSKSLSESKKEQLLVVRWLSELSDFSYDPGLKDDDVPGECRLKTFKMMRLAVNQTFSTPDYLKACEEHITTGSTSVLGNMYRTLKIHYPLDDNPYVKKIVINLPGNVKLPGLIAMKDTVHPRPWVILRAGIFGNSVDLVAERFLFIQLFEQGPFNILFLDSSTSPETIRLNDRQAVGGLDEGLQTYQVAERLKSPDEPLHRLVTDVHLLAISLGGHGLMMTMMLDQLNTPIIKSAVALCPLLQMGKTFERHEKETGYGMILNFWAWKRLAPLREKVAGISIGNALHDAFQYVRYAYKGPLSMESRLKWPEGLDLKNFDRANDLFPHLQLIKKPIRVLASQKDLLVPFDLNTGALLEEQKKGELKNFEIATLKESYHCTLPGPYAWDEISDLILAQFTGLDESLKRDFVMHEEDLPSTGNSGPISTRLQFHLKAGDSELEVRVGDGSVRIPIDNLGWATVGRVRSDAEALLLIRWARHNIELVAGEEGRLKLRWRIPTPLLETADVSATVWRHLERMSD